MSVIGMSRKWYGCGMLLAVFLTGCQQDRLTRNSFSQVRQNASTQEDVRATLGEPSAVLGDRWIYERPDQHLTVLIDFDEQGHVLRKQWVDGVTGEWQDTKDSSSGAGGRP